MPRDGSKPSSLALCLPQQALIWCSYHLSFANRQSGLIAQVLPGAHPRHPVQPIAGNEHRRKSTFRIVDAYRAKGIQPEAHAAFR